MIKVLVAGLLGTVVGIVVMVVVIVATVAGASGTIGPNLGTAVAADAKKDNMALDAFIKQSITDPGAYTAAGGPWATPMPSSFGSSLSATQIDDLVALIVSGQGK
jgi:hypothetical protein